MRRRTLYFLVGITILALASLLVDTAGTIGKFKIFGHGTAITQGLDLTGGLRLLLQARDPKAATNDAMNAAVDVITKRIDAFGVAAPSITRVGANQIDVEIPNVRNPTEVRTTLGSTGQLVIYGMGTLPVLAQGAVFPYHTTTLCNVAKPPSPCVVITGADLDSSQISVGYDNFGAPLVNAGTKGPGVDRFSQYTGAHIGQNMAIVLDGKVITDPTIQAALSTSWQITGIGSIDEANTISISLKYGALPIAFNIVASQQVSATLGPQYVHASIVAGIIGLAIVIFFMLAYYRLPGLLADLALIIYGLVVFAVFKLIPVTLTLEGIAGFVLSIGMAVDANILIFERMKEELRAGKTLGAAIEAGFNRAWPSIRDSNISTMITCAVLYEFGQNFAASIIVGFATTLFIGVVISMFTAVVVTRTFLRALVRGNRSYNPWLFGVSNMTGAGREPQMGRTSVSSR
ncbi:MAG TPA: protein translocase subunit SecD [Chloroflexota bacterium]|nr:protein translocase subunit SecD [Chloroflexota bacterium]